MPAPCSGRMRIRPSGRYEGCRSSCTVGRVRILLAGSVTCSTLSMTRRFWCTRGSVCLPTRGADTGSGSGHGSPDRVPGWGGGVPEPDSGFSEVWRVRAGRGAAGGDTEGEREGPQAGYSHRGRPGGAGEPQGGAGTHLRGGLPTVLLRVPSSPSRPGCDL